MIRFSTVPTGPRSAGGRPCRWLLLLLLLLVGPGAWAQAGAPVWERPITAMQGINSHLAVFATATNAAGDVFLAGQFRGEALFGNTTLRSTSSVRISQYRTDDVFVAKWSKAAGRFMWAVQAGGNELDKLTYLVVRGPAIYIGGTFASDTMTVGATQVVVPRSIYGVGTKTFVARLTDAGSSASFGWALGCPLSLTGLVATTAGLHLTGEYGGVIQLGAFTLTSVLSQSGLPTSAAFLATIGETNSGVSFTQARNLTLFQPATNTVNNQFHPHALTADGNHLYLAGKCAPGTLLVDNSPAATTLGGFFVLRLTVSGTTLVTDWMVATAQSSQAFLWDVQARAVAVSGTSVVVTGGFQGGCSMGANDLLAAGGISNSVHPDVFVAKLTDAGSSARFDWGLQVGSTYDDFGTGIAIRGTEIFLAASVYTYSGNSGYGYHGEVRKIVDGGSRGSFVWTKIGGSGNDEVANLALANDGTVYMAITLGGGGGFGQYGVPSIVSSTGTSQGGTLGAVASLLATTALATRPTTGPLAGSSLYPNPAHATAIVQLPPLPGTATLILTDALGRTVRTTTVALPPAGLRHELDLAGLPAGLYALRVVAGGASTTHRLTVE